MASVCYQGLMHINQSMDAIERSITNYGGLQAANLEKGCSWIKLFIAMAPSLGFLGTVIGMVMAFDQIQQAGDIGPKIVASGMKVALITTIFGIRVSSMNGLQFTVYGLQLITWHAQIIGGSRVVSANRRVVSACSGVVSAYRSNHL